jgi:hypothetical protein
VNAGPNPDSRRTEAVITRTPTSMKSRFESPARCKKATAATTFIAITPFKFRQLQPASRQWRDQRQTAPGVL